MKKSLLIALLAGAFCAGAQNRVAPGTIHHGTAVTTSAERTSDPVVVKTNAIPSTGATLHQTARRAGNGNHTQSLCESALGSAGNQFGTAFGPKTNLNYNRDLNTLTFIHRSNDLAAIPWPNTANILYDISTDGGATWLVDQGPIYADNTNIIRARYPQGGLYNPPGNTDPANAYATAFGMCTDGTNWVSLYKGTSQVGTTTQVQSTYDFATYGLPLSTLGFVPQGGCIIKNTGDTWWSAGGNDGVGYNDTVLLSHGVFNSSTHDFDYTFKKLYAPVCTDNNAVKLYSDCAVIFNDAGDKGYMVILGNDWVCNWDVNDSANGIIVYKTIDGGNTWSHIHSPDTKMVDGQLLNGGFAYSSSRQLDLAMDGDDHLHIALAIVPFQPGNGIFLGYTFGSWGLFDFTTANDADWSACLLAKPETYFGDFGIAGSTVDPELQEESRVQISRNWDGSKLFYSWFDTDTAIFGAGLNNFPDMHCIGRDLDGDLWTAEVNFTEFSGTSADGNSIFGNVSYYTINDGTNENVPFVTDVFTGVGNGGATTTGAPVNFFYEGCGAMSNYVNTGNCAIVTGSLGLNNHSSAANAFGVSSNYPNPYTGKTSVDVTLVKVSDVTIEISNAVGQVLSTVTYKNLHSGVNTLTLDGSSLSKGLYFYTVKAGSESSTKTMSVE